MAYTFDQIFAADPSNPERVASNGVVTIFAPGDETRTPLTITTVDGMPIQNPVKVNDSGHGPAFVHETLDRVAWEGGGFSGFLTSYEGMKAEAVAARVSAGEAAMAAAEAAANSITPTADAIEQAIITEGTPARAAVAMVAQQAAAVKLDRKEAIDTFAVKPDGGGKPVGKGELVLNVRDFGAVGDGITSDTTAFQSALNAVGAIGGGTVFVPNPGAGGEYRVGKLHAVSDTTITIEPGTVLRRHGGTFGVVNYPKDGSSPFRDVRDPYSGQGNITIDGGIWEGYAPDHPYSPDGYGLGFNCFHFLGARNITLRNVTVLNIATNHAIDVNGIDGMRVIECEFRGYRDTSANQDRNYTEAIQYGTYQDEGTGGWATVGNGAPSKNIIVDKCVFGPSDREGAWPAGLGNHSMPNPTPQYGPTREVRVLNSEFIEMPFAALVLLGFSQVSIHNNTFTKCKIGVRVTNAIASRVWDTATKAWLPAPSRIRVTDIEVKDNRFTDTVDTDILVLGTGMSQIDGTWDHISRVQIHGNIRTRTAAGRSAGPFVRALLNDHISVTSNYAEKCSIGIALESCRNTTIAGNEIEDTQGYGIQTSNVNFPTGTSWTIEGHSITNNRVKRAGTHGIGANSVSQFVVSMNQITDAARLSNASGILMSGASAGLVQGNSIQGDKTFTGISAPSATNINITPDNRIVGAATPLSSINGAGVVYGAIQY